MLHGVNNRVSVAFPLLLVLLLIALEGLEVRQWGRIWEGGAEKERGREG